MKQTTTAAISLLLTALPCAAADFFLRNGDKVAMIGDSITEQHLYSTYVEAWTLTRFPAWDLKFFNVGIGGDNATWGGERFKRDVVGCGATAMTVNFGMNDCGGPGSTFDENRYKEFKNAMQKIADEVKAVAAAISAKNSYFHDRIFCEVLRGGDVPAFMEMKREQVEAKRMEVFNERMKKMPALFEAIQKARVMQAHQVEIVNAK